MKKYILLQKYFFTEREGSIIFYFSLRCVQLVFGLSHGNKILFIGWLTNASGTKLWLDTEGLGLVK